MDKNKTWMEDGACRKPEHDPDLWFGNDMGSVNRAKKICVRECPVRKQCFEYAVNFPVQLSGVWGGMGARGIQTHRRALGITVIDERQLSKLPTGHQGDAKIDHEQQGRTTEEDKAGDLDDYPDYKG